jgi:hypothetical protein
MNITSHKSMVAEHSLETDHKIHVDETAALARTSGYINHVEKRAIYIHLQVSNSQHR